MKKWRWDLSKSEGVAPFIILHDATLIELCRRRPVNREQLLEISGIGQRKAELYGDAIIQALHKWTAAQP